VIFCFCNFLAICRPSGCTVASGIVIIVVVGICSRSQMRTSKFTCLIFGVSIGLDPGYKCTKGIFDRSKFKVTCDISPTISGWLLVFSANMRIIVVVIAVVVTAAAGVVTISCLGEGCEVLLRVCLFICLSVCLTARISQKLQYSPLICTSDISTIRLYACHVCSPN